MQANDKFKSDFERKIAKDLGSKTQEYLYEKERFNYSLYKKYTPDFFLPNGVIIESKGKFTREDRAKHLAVRDQNPELDIRFVFMRDNKLSKNHKMKYSDWCNKHGFQYHIGTVPEEWIKETKRYDS